VSQRRKAIARAAMIAVLAAGLLPARVAWAAGSDDVQDLRREVSRMRAEVQALQLALAETTELERQRSANLTRALKAPSPSSEPAAPPPAAPADSEPAAAPTPARPAGPSTPAASGDEKRRGSNHRRHRRSPRSRSKAARHHADASDR
jgi:hypothetical protein